MSGWQSSVLSTFDRSEPAFYLQLNITTLLRTRCECLLTSILAAAIGFFVCSTFGVYSTCVVKGY